MQEETGALINIRDGGCVASQRSSAAISAEFLSAIAQI
jgi:hypothetical protein